MEKTKITNHQLLSLTANSSIGGSVIVIAALVVSIAKQDAWIATLLTPVFGMPIIWIYWFLGSRYPDKTFVGIIKKIFGKWIGLIAAASFVLLCLLVSCQIPWYVGYFITTQALPETPIYVINLLFVTAFVIGILYGIESIARASELFLYFVLIVFFLAMILVSPNAKIENLQPVFENGVIPVLKSTVFLSSFLTFPLVILLMIYPIHLNSIQKTKKSFFKGYLWANLVIFTAIIMSTLVLGSTITANTHYPTYLLATEINVGMILTRLEFLIAAIWIVTQFMIGILFFYAGVIGLSELIGLKEHKKIVIPLGLIILVMSEVVFPNDVYQANWDSLVWPPYIITHGLILPVLLLLVYLIKRVCIPNK